MGGNLKMDGDQSTDESGNPPPPVDQQPPNHSPKPLNLTPKQTPPKKKTPKGKRSEQIAFPQTCSGPDDIEALLRSVKSQETFTNAKYSFIIDSGFMDSKFVLKHHARDNRYRIRNSKGQLFSCKIHPKTQTLFCAYFQPPVIERWLSQLDVVNVLPDNKREPPSFVVQPA